MREMLLLLLPITLILREHGGLPYDVIEEPILQAFPIHYSVYGIVIVV